MSTYGVTTTTPPAVASDVLIGDDHVIKDIEFGASLTIAKNSCVEYDSGAWDLYASAAGATAYAAILEAVSTGVGETQKVPAVISGEISRANVASCPDVPVLGLLIVGD
jgi:hypothetical protein